MTYECLIVEKKEEICTITLNRPNSYNALDFTILPELEHCLDDCGNDPNIHVVVLTGAGAAFCSGGDIVLFDSHPKGAPYVCHELTKNLNRIIIELRRMPQPVIACINGAVGGAGISLAAACDIRIASTTAKFRQGYTGIGLVPDGGWTLTIPLLIGWGRACELLFFNRTFDAEQALRWGLVNQIAHPEHLTYTTWKLAKELAAGPRQAFAIIKEKLNRAFLGGLELQLEEDRRGIVMAARTKDSKEGFRAFLEKRKPNFSQRPYVFSNDID